MNRLALAVSEERDWRNYEEQIRQRLIELAGGDDQAEVQFDAKVPGRHSKTDRQVDVYVEGSFAGNVGRGTMAVDCKCFSRPVHVKDVEVFIGLVEDVGTDFGLLVTTEAFSEAALNRAKATRGVRVEIVPYDELAAWTPEVLFCPICTDLDSERAPGPLYLDPIPPDTPGGTLAMGAGRCWKCDAISMRCSCGELNSMYESKEGEWRPCQAGCGVEWLAETELDRKGMPEGERLEFRQSADGGSA